MATSEASSATAGPRYAPDDPTLPKPWKGLIDGITGIFYYWNPETNVTQYERPPPSSAPPPLPPGPPPGSSTPKLAAVPGHANGVVAQGEQQQVASSMQSQGQQFSQFIQQHGQVLSQQPISTISQVSEHQGSQQQNSPLGPAMQHQAQFVAQQMRPQMIPHTCPHGMQQMGQNMSQQSTHYYSQQQGLQLSQPLGQPMQQPTLHQMSQQQGQQSVQQPNPQMAQPEGHSYAPQHFQFAPYQQTMIPQVQTNVQQQAQLSAQDQQPSNTQEFKSSFPRREEYDFQHGNDAKISPQFPQMAAPTSRNPHTGTNSVQMPPQMGAHLGQPQQFASTNMQQPTSITPLQQGGKDLIQVQQIPMLQNQMGPANVHGNQPRINPLPGLKGGNEDARVGNDCYRGPYREGPILGPQQPALSAIPSGRNQQDMRTGGGHLQNMMPTHGGGINVVAGPGMHDMYGHAGPPYPNNVLIKPPFVGAPDTPGLSAADAYRKQHDVTAIGENIPAPFMTFETTGFPPELLREIHSAGFSSPTPIQAQTWPIALQGKDIVAIAKTGSGKTLGYVIPAFMLLRQRRNNPRNGPTVLVLAPTRELATQIQEEARKFGHSSNVSCTCLYGGAPKAAQLKELEFGADIVVATPGRLNDILEMRKIDFRQVSLLVLDEADRMLDMGFEPQIRKIVNEIPPHRQTLMYTATWPKEVRKIASDLLVNPVQVNIGSVDELVANKAITQYVEVVPQMEKERRLQEILRAQERGSKIIIFCSTKRLCDQLTRNLGRFFGAAAIHGDKSQGERDWVLNQFRSGKSPILVATDVAARGLDIKDIRVVINYDFPTGIEDYVHRIGRTGRAGATGVAYTFFSEQDWKYAPDLIRVLEGTNQQVPPQVREIALHGGPGFGKDRSGISRFDSPAGTRWDSGGRGGMREGGFGGRGGMRDGGRGGMRDGGFGGRGGMRDGGFSGRGGMRDGGFGFPGGRGESFSGHGGRGRSFGGPGGGHVGRGRNERGFHDRNNNFDGRGRGRGRGRFDNRREMMAERSRGRSYSRSPERVRTRGYSRSRSRSQNHGRSRSHSRSRSRSRSWSRSRSRSRSWSRDRNRSYSRSPRRSRSHSCGRVRGFERSNELAHERFDQMGDANPESVAAHKSGISPKSPLIETHDPPITDPAEPVQVVETAEPVQASVDADPAPELTPES